MAVPKRKTSKARRDKRRNNLWKLNAPTLVRCSNCGEYKRPGDLILLCFLSIGLCLFRIFAEQMLKI